MADLTAYTDADRVKRSLFPGNPSPPTTHDALIASAIAEVTSRIKVRLDNREFGEVEHTEYVDGDGTNRLLLRNGPLVSVTSVAHVAYSEDEDGDRVETESAITTGDYLLGGLRDEGWTGRGFLRRLRGMWCAGYRNHKVVYTAGYDSAPAFLQEAATNAVLNAIQMQPGVKSLRLGDYRIERFDPQKVDQAVERAIAPLVDMNLV